MTSFLQTQIKQRIEDKNLTIAALEKKAGLGHNAVRGILVGTVQNPGLKTLQAISEVLECSLNDLLDDKRESSSIVSKKSYEWDLDLFIQSCRVVDDYIKKNTLKFPTDKIIKIVWEIYTFSISQTPPKIDPKFCEWLFNKD